MENLQFEVRANIKFLTKLGWESTKIIESLQVVYGESAPKQSTVYKWMKRFQGGQEALGDEDRSGRPSSSTSEENVIAVESLLAEDRRISVREIAHTLDISIGSAQSILTDRLKLSKLSARWVPKALRDEHRSQRAEQAIAFLNRLDADAEEFYDRLVTGDETWIYQYDPESKIQSKQWLPRGSSGPTKVKAERSVKKVLATIFWDAKGIILVDFLEGQKTVTGIYYQDVLRKLHAALVKKRPGKIHQRILFHHDNAPAHSSTISRAVLREFRWEILTHPPYSPDLAPSDFFCFQK
jgi:histone-lysine N-methyltransferase SETMAR